MRKTLDNIHPGIIAVVSALIAVILAPSITYFSNLLLQTPDGSLLIPIYGVLRLIVGLIWITAILGTLFGIAGLITRIFRRN